MKKLICLTIIICMCVSLCGCSPIFSNYRDVEQLTIIQTLGIDKGERGVLLSLATGTTGKEDKPDEKLTGESRSIADAIDRIRDNSYDTELFYAHINHIVIGEDAAGSGLEEYMKFICRSPEIRIDVPVYVIRGAAASEAVANAGSGADGITEILVEVQQNLRLYADGGETTVADIVSGHERGGSTLICALEYVPAANVKEKDSSQSGESGEESGGSSGESGGSSGESGGESGMGSGESGGAQSEQSSSGGQSNMTLAPAGYAIIHGGKLDGFIDKDLAPAVGLLTNDVKFFDVTVDAGNGGEAVIEVNSGGSKIKPIWDGDKLKGLSIEATVNAVLTELQGKADDDALTARLERAVLAKLRELLQLSQALESDFLCLEAPVHNDSPARLEALEAQFSKLLPTLELRISVSAQLSHTNDIKDDQ